MKHRLTMRYSKTEGELVWRYNSHRTKHLGYEIAQAITKERNEGHLTTEEFVKLKLTCTFETESDGSGNEKK